MIKFQIKQQVRTVKKSWLEVVSELPGHGERLAQAEYNRIIVDNPNEYFELVRIETNEECLAFTLQPDLND